MKNNVEKRNLADFKKDFLELENMNEIKGGYNFNFCLTIEVKQCLSEEARYCGNNVHEITGPVNPWGTR